MPAAGADSGAPAAAWKAWGCDVAAQLGRVRDALVRRREAAAGMKETCEKTIPLLQEMIEHQTDADRMHRLFVDVDRLRGKVGEDPATFEMVCHLNTIGELRRYQADLTVKAAAADSLERQKRQLQRDVEYVGDLKVGAERLLEILDEAMGRLDRQLAAAKAGMPWPREVAGA
jgi:F0F1-type ATP synthase beta subunit